jgi:hypothetical protein
MRLKKKIIVDLLWRYLVADVDANVSIQGVAIPIELGDLWVIGNTGIAWAVRPGFMVDRPGQICVVSEALIKGSHINHIYGNSIYLWKPDFYILCCEIAHNTEKLKKKRVHNTQR